MAVVGSTVFSDGDICPHCVDDFVDTHDVDQYGFRKKGVAWVSQSMMDRLLHAYHPMRVRDLYPIGKEIVTGIGYVLFCIDNSLDPDVMEFRTEDC